MNDIEKLMKLAGLKAKTVTEATLNEGTYLYKNGRGGATLEVSDERGSDKIELTPIDVAKIKNLIGNSSSYRIENNGDPIVATRHGDVVHFVGKSFKGAMAFSKFSGKLAPGEMTGSDGKVAFDESETLSEDWGSSDWSILLRGMKDAVDRGQSLDDAAYDAALAYHTSIGYPDVDDAIGSILHMWKVRKMDQFDPKAIGEADGEADTTTVYVLMIRGGRAGEDLVKETFEVPTNLKSGQELWDWYNNEFEEGEYEPPDIVPNGEDVEDWNKIHEAITTGQAYVYWDVYGEGVIGITANRSKTKELKKKVQEEFYDMDDDDDPFESIEEEVDHTKPANAPDTMEYDLRAFDFKGRGSLPNRYVQSRYSDNPLKNAKQIADESADPLMAELEAFLAESADDEDGSDEAFREREDKRKAEKKKKAEKKGDDLEEGAGLKRAFAAAKKSRGEKMSKQDQKDLDADTLAKRMQDGKSKKKVAEAEYKPGVTVLTRSMHVPEDHEWEALKKITWPYGVSVQMDELTHDVTFKTAKMKTVARLLSKVIDFGDTTAADVLDLPMELVYH